MVINTGRDEMIRILAWQPVPPLRRSNVFFVELDISPSRGIDKRKLVRCHPDDLTVLIMKLQQPVRKFAHQHGADVGKSKGSP